MAKTKHYVNNADFLEALIKYRADIKIAEENEEEKPPLPDYIGECFLLIAQRLSFRPNFIHKYDGNIKHCLIDYSLDN